MIAIEVDDAELRAALDLLKDPRKGVRASMLKSLAALAEEARTAIAKEIQSRLTKDPTGRLSRSFKIRLVDGGHESSEVYAEIASQSVYANIQDEGGRIVAKGKRLAIPIRGIAGAPRRGQGPRDFPRKLFLLPRPGRPPLLAEEKKVKKGHYGPGNIIPRFVLKTSVKIPGVHYLDAAEAYTQAQIERVVGKELGDKLQIVGGRHG